MSSSSTPASTTYAEANYAKTTIHRACLAVVLAVLLLAVPQGALAQLTPDRTYYGHGREIPVTVQSPEGEDGEAHIVLFNAAGDRVARASVLPGAVDLASFFPILWSQNEPQVLYAQMYLDDASADGGDPGDLGEPIGPPLVLQPLVTPLRAMNNPDGSIRWQEAPQLFSGMRIYVDKLLELNTTEGEMVFRFRPDEAPNTVWHIRELAGGGFYTDIPFHRVVPTHPTGMPFVIQAGDPTGSGMGGPGVNIDLEPSELPHAFGVLSMARGRNPDSNGSQFFIALSREATTHLNGNYTAFAEAIAGTDAILAIERTPLDPGTGAPVQAPRIISAQLVDAPPFGTEPSPVQRPAASGER